MIGVVSFCIWQDKKEMSKKLIELKDCHFKFSFNSSGLIKFKLDTAILYCACRFGIRRNGTYGLKELVLEGINQRWGGSIPLEMGESIFPIVESIKKFEGWSSKKIFKTSWDEWLFKCWENTLSNLDNLDYLEYKYDEGKKHK